MKKLSSTLGDSLINCAAIEGDGKIENSELVIWNETHSLSLFGKEIIDLYYLIKKGIDRTIIQS